MEEDLFLTIVLVVFLDETFLAGEGIFSAIFLTARACLPELEGATFDLLEVLVESDFFAVAFLLSAFGLETLLLLEDLACLGLAAFELVLVAIFLALMGIKIWQDNGSTQLGKNFGTTRRNFSPGFNLNKFRDPAPATRTTKSGCVPS